MQYAECSSEPSALHLKNLIICMCKIISPLPLYVDMKCDLLGQVVAVKWLAQLFHVWEILDQNLGIETGCPELLCSFSQSVHAVAGSVSEIRLWLLSSTFFAVHYSLIIPVFGLLRLLTL